VSDTEEPIAPRPLLSRPPVQIAIAFGGSGLLLGCILLTALLAGRSRTPPAGSPSRPGTTPQVEAARPVLAKGKEEPLTPAQQKAQALVDQAWDKVRQKDPGRALPLVAEALELDPDHTGAIFIRGLANAQIACDPVWQTPDHGMGRLAKALVDLDRAAAKRPELAAEIRDVYRKTYRNKAAVMGLD